jgi:hypothetical protein
MSPSPGPRLALLLAVAVPLAVQTPQEKHLLRLSFQPGTSHFYRMTMGMQTKAKLGDKGLTVDMTMEQVMEMKCVEVKDGKALVEWTTQRLILKGTGPIEVDYDSDVEGSNPGMLRKAVDMLDETIALRMDERGKLSDLQVPEAFEALGLFGSGGVEEVISQAMPQLPEAPVSIGDRWETDANVEMGKYGSGQLKLVNKVSAVEKGSVRIEQEIQMDLDVSDVPGGGEFHPGKCAGSTVIDLATGCLREADMDSAMTVTGGMSLEMVMKTKMRKIDAPPAKTQAGEGK